MVWMVFAPKNRVLLRTTRKRPGTWAKQRPDKKKPSPWDVVPVRYPEETTL